MIILSNTVEPIVYRLLLECDNSSHSFFEILCCLTYAHACSVFEDVLERCSNHAAGCLCSRVDNCFANTKMKSRISSSASFAVCRYDHSLEHSRTNRVSPPVGVRQFLAQLFRDLVLFNLCACVFAFFKMYMNDVQITERDV